MSMSKKDEIVAVIKQCAEKLGRAPSQAEFRRASKISWHQIYKHFRGMRAAVRAAGLEPGPKGGPLNEKALVLDWARVARELGRLPSRAEYSARGKHHSVTLHARLGWSQMGHRFVLLTREFHIEREWGDVLETVWKKFPLLKTVGRLPELHPSKPTSGLPGAPELPKTFTAEIAEDAEDRVIGTSGHRVIGSAKAEERFAADERRWPQIRQGHEFTQRETSQGMRLGKVAAAAPAIKILMAAAVSAQASAAEAGINASSTAGLKAHSTPALCSVAQGRPCSAPLEPECSAAQGGHHITSGTKTGPVVYGEPLGLAAMAHAPTNEDGVLFLFGVLAAELGFRVERIQRGFPDCEAKREVVPGKWERVWIEFELESRNFKEHRHDPKGCQAIVCWRHNWPDAPEGLEIIALEQVVKGR
jgi:HNH endonuclease